MGPATRLLFAGNWSITVIGALQVAAPANDALFGLAPNATSTTWGGIRVLPGGRANLSGARLESAVTAVECQRCATLDLADLTIINSTIAGVNAYGDALVRVRGLVVVGGVVGVGLTNVSNASLFDVSVSETVSGFALFRINDTAFANITTWASKSSYLDTTIGIEIRQSRGMEFHQIASTATFGIWVSGTGTSDLLIEGAAISSPYGVRMWGLTSNGTFANFTNTDGIFSGFDMYNARDVTLTNVKITQGNGVGLGWCDNVTMRGLYLINGTSGVYIEGSQGILVQDSLFIGGHGVSALNVLQLRVIDNTFLDLVSVAFSFQNVRVSTISGNNMIGGPFFAYSEGGGANLWDSMGVGNFWYPHNYTDADGDLIGDTPYNISGGTEADMFPRMLAWTTSPPWSALTAPSSSPQDLGFEVIYAGGDFLGHAAFSFTVSGNGSAAISNATVATIRIHSVGLQSVTLTVTNLGGLVSTTTAWVQVVDTEPPRPTIAGPSAVPTGGTAVFDPLATTDNDPSFPTGRLLSWSITDPFGIVTTVTAPFGNLTFSPLSVGVYEIRCVFMDASGNSNSTILTLMATDAMAPTLLPLAGGMAAEDVPVTFGPPVLYDDDATVNSTGSFFWHFTRSGGPELTSASRIANLTFAQPGRYNGTLTVCDAAGRCTTTTFQTAVKDTTPPDLSGIAAFHLNASHASVIDAAGAADNDPSWPMGASFSWTIDTPTGPLNLSGFFVLVTLPAPGTYRGHLTAGDAAGNRATATIDIVAIDVDPPEAFADIPAVFELGESTWLTANRSWDASPPITAVWEFGDGSPDARGLAVSHVFSAVSYLLVKVTVMDAAGNDRSLTLAVRVVDTRAPTIEILLPERYDRNVTAAKDVALRFEAVAHDASGIGIITWDFGDGQSANGPAANHSYDKPGTFRVRVTAVDRSGNMNETVFAVWVPGAPDSGEFGVVLWAFAIAAAAFGVFFLFRAWRSRHRAP